MLRFVPDTWQGVLLRPILLADPVAGLYSELHAPDWRFVLVALFLGIAAALRRSRPLLSGAQWQALIGLLACFYLWTIVSGNGRYYFWGLLLIGPLVVVAARRLPATRAMRNTCILAAAALQVWVVLMTYEPNVWALRPWVKGPGLALFADPLTKQPAVFVTVGSMSHSILVPQMHPASRWSNIGGQIDLVPGMREYTQQQELFSSPLPKYGVVQAAKQVMTDDRQPIEAAWDVMRRVFEQQGLAPTSRPCIFLRADLGGLPFHLRALHEMERGFWFCELEKVKRDSKDAEGWHPRAPEYDDVFAQVEKRCPRYFPAGNAVTRFSGDGVVRHYSRSDTSLSINQVGAVYFKNMRALNPTELGMVDAIRAGQFHLACDRLPGRYLPPWSRGWGVDLE